MRCSSRTRRGRTPRASIHEDGEFGDVGATISAWLGAKHPGKGAPGRVDHREMRVVRALNDPDARRSPVRRPRTGLAARKAVYRERHRPRRAGACARGRSRATRRTRVLEVGCGEGELAERLTATVAEVVAVDQSPRMVELTRARGVDAHVADVQQLPFPDASFDAVLAAWMLYHVPDLDRGLSEVARVLRPGGRLVATTNGADHLAELLALGGIERWELPFEAENGAEILGRHFASVRAAGCLRHGDVSRHRARSLVLRLVRAPDRRPRPTSRRRSTAPWSARRLPGGLASRVL